MSETNNKPATNNGRKEKPRQPYVKGRVWIFAPQERLIEWESWLAENPDFRFYVHKEVNFTIRREPLSDPRNENLVEVFSSDPDKREWQPIDVSGIKLPDTEGLSRRYLYFPNQEVPTQEVVQALNRFFSESKFAESALPDFSALKANPDHILTFTHVPGLSPIKIKGRRPPTTNELTLAANFSNQPCWQAMGADKDYRDKLKFKGDDVTVVIVDAAPERSRINHSLVDFVVTLKEPAVNFGPEEGIDFLSIRDLKAMNKVQPPEAPLVFDDPINDGIEPGNLEVYHGLLIASLIRELAPNVRIVLVKAFNDVGETSGSLFKTAVNFVLALLEQDLIINNQPVKIVKDPKKLVFNFSLGIPVSSLREEVDALYILEECDKACKGNAVIVAAAGNGSYYQHPRNPEEPAAYGYFADAYFSTQPTTFEQVIAVSASPSNPNIREYALYSNQGNLAAPDYYLLMDTGDDNNPNFPRYVYWAGTSFATPLVSGSVAILLSAGVPPEQVKNCIWQSAKKPQNWWGVPVIDLQGAVNNWLGVTSSNWTDRLGNYTCKGLTFIKGLLVRIRQLPGSR